MKISIAQAVFGGVLIISACSAQGEPPPKRVREFLGEHAVKIMADPQNVQVWRVAGSPVATTEPATTQPANDRIRGHRIVAKAPDQDAAFGRRLAAIFFSPDAYWFDAAKGCMFQADTLLRVHGPGGFVDFILCFHCEEFRMIACDADGKTVHGGAEDFDGVRPKLAELRDGREAISAIKSGYSWRR